MFKNILVPHAGTKAGDKAIEFATNMAKIYGDSKITILHVVENIPVPPSLAFHLERNEIAKQFKQVRGDLKKEMYNRLNFKAKKIKKQGVAATVRILHGHPDEEITRVVNENSYDIVIMAKRRRLRGLKGILQLGSVSRKVLERISCPVVLIDGEK
ncbi:MAG: universal stress protein [Nitrososphaeraceae archaeon]